MEKGSLRKDTKPRIMEKPHKKGTEISAFFVERIGLEPITLTLPVLRSSQMS